MRSVIVIAHLSLDGVIQAPSGPEEDPSDGFAHGGWSAPYASEQIGASVRAQMAMEFDLLLGRKTYDIWATYWPHHGEIWPNVNKATKYVASRTRASGDWQPAVFLGGDLAEQVALLKQQPGADLHVYGSGNLLQTLIRDDLIDAYWLKIYPVTVGSGKRLFAGDAPLAAYSLTEGQMTPNGVLLVRYDRARTDASPT